MIRVLQCVNNMHRAGLETMLMNYYRHIDRSEIQFDFLTHRAEKDDYDEEILSLGGKVYYAPRLYPQNLPRYFNYMDAFFKEHHEYKIMHSHIDSMSYLPLKAGLKAGIPIRIAHSHNTSIDRDFKYLLKMYYRSKITSVATDFLACGVEAGNFLFNNKKFTVIPNAIEPASFRFNEEIRMKKREELGITDEVVIGHIGRISYQKNHKFLIEIFNEIVKSYANSLLLIVGVGEKEEEIRQLVSNYGLAEKVKFLGKRSDVNELYQAMDAFVMPSFFEGVPVVGVEAQYAKLPCFFSDKVPEEVKFSENVHFIELRVPAEEWARRIMEHVSSFSDRSKTFVDETKYDIGSTFMSLTDFYKEINNRLERLK